MKLSIAPALLAALITAPVSAQVHVPGLDELSRREILVVDDDGARGADYVEIRDAVDAASAGDLIIVREGSYLGFDVDGKGLSIVAADQFVFVGCSSIRNVPASDSMVVAGMRFFADSPCTVNRLDVVDNDGPIWIQGCECPFGDPTFLIERSRSVAIIRTSSGSILEQHGLEARDSSVHFLGSDTVGSGLADVGHGFLVEDAFLYAAGCTFRGGQGASQSPWPFCGGDALEGGDGLHVVGATSQVFSLDCTYLAGQGGTSDPLCPLIPPGADGSAIEVVAGSFTQLEGTSRSLRTSTPIVGGAATFSVIEGEPGDVVFVMAAQRQRHRFLPARGLSELLAPPVTTELIGLVPASGTLTVSVAFAPPPPGAEFIEFFLQPAMIDLGGRLHLGHGAILHVLR